MTNIKKIEVPDKVGEEMLANILERVGQDPNSMSLQDLISYSKYRRERFGVEKLVAIIFFIILLLLPFFFIKPSITVTDVTDKYDGEKAYEIVVDSVLPITTVSATTDEYKYQVKEAQTHDYIVFPSYNGEMTIEVIGFNYQNAIEVVTVEGIDTDAPYITGNDKQDGKILIYVADDASGIDYASTMAIDMSGNVINPEYDSEKGIIYLDSDTTVNLFVYDIKGNTLQLVVTVE